MSEPLSWGGYPRVHHRQVHQIHWRHEPIHFENLDQPVLPFGYGRSYGDSCLNEGGELLLTKSLNRFIAFDEQRGILECEAGISLADILKIFVPRGWFLPVTPGTQYVSVGGAIANDVHGKNHHQAGTFGCHILAFELLRSNGERMTCSPNHNAELFHATIGGLGLTGLMTWARLRLKSIPGPMIATERIRFNKLDEFFDLSHESDRRFEYTVAWVDCFAKRCNLGRGLFIRGNHASVDQSSDLPPSSKHRLTIPINAPSFLLNSWAMKVFNSLYFHIQRTHQMQALVPYEGFFYPLDSVRHWNRLYGSRGFLQYQCVIPSDHERDGIRELLTVIQRAKQGAFFAVLKRFGHILSPGLLSFPRPGTTLALDFPFLGDQTLSLLTKLDQIVRETGGAVYPAKDARMSAKDFQAYFPGWEDFNQYKDPMYSSSFWRRVTEHHQPHPSQSKESLMAQSRNTKEMLAGSRC